MELLPLEETEAISVNELCGVFLSITNFCRLVSSLVCHSSLTLSDSLLEVCRKEVLSGKSFDEVLVAHKLKVRPENALYANELKEVGNNKFAKAAFELKKIGDISEIVSDEKGKSILKLVNKETSRLKSFDEAKPEVTSTYQDIESAQLENEYITRLKNTYKPKIFYDELSKAFKD